MFIKNKKGFTLVEILIALAVLAVLSSLLVPSFLHINNDAAKGKDDAKFQSMSTAFKKTLSEQEVLIYLEKNNVFDPDETSNANRIYMCFEVPQGGELNWEDGYLFYTNGLTQERVFKESKIWINTYQSIEKKYEVEFSEYWNKIIVFTMYPKTPDKVASCSYQIITKDQLPDSLKGRF